MRDLFGLAGGNTRTPSINKAAMYVRMSTDHQKYSTENQAEAIKEHAKRKNLEIIKTYADEGKSGLNLAGRDALKSLIDDVQNNRAEFKVILVLDVPMKAPITNIFAAVPVLMCSMWQSSLRMMAARYPISLRA